MVFMRRGKANVLDKEPYITFLKKYNKLRNLVNEKIHMRISSNSKKSGFTDGFALDYCYAKWFDLDFEFYKLFDEECIQNQKFCVMHRISYKFDEDYYQEMMMDTIGDIQERADYYYLSSFVDECIVNCAVNNKNVVTVSFCAYCDMKDAKEVCLQLISQDIVLFTRSF